MLIVQLGLSQKMNNSPDGSRAKPFSMTKTANMALKKYIFWHFTIVIYVLPFGTVLADEKSIFFKEEGCCAALMRS